MSLKDKNVIVTGGSPGLGLGLVEALADRGARVTVIARNVDAHRSGLIQWACANRCPHCNRRGPCRPKPWRPPNDVVVAALAACDVDAPLARMRIRQLHDFDRAHVTQIFYFHKGPEVRRKGPRRVGRQSAPYLRELQHGVIRHACGHPVVAPLSDLLGAGGRIGFAVAVPHAPGKESVKVT